MRHSDGEGDRTTGEPERAPGNAAERRGTPPDDEEAHRMISA
jgi:hypothetical protein